jgi:hypothetical protein
LAWTTAANTNKGKTTGRTLREDSLMAIAYFDRL